MRKSICAANVALLTWHVGTRMALHAMVHCLAREEALARGSALVSTARALLMTNLFIPCKMRLKGSAVAAV